MAIEKRVKALAQACDILAIAHSENIVFYDHKILHYYWCKHRDHVEMIDWNIGRYYESGVSDDDKVKDLILFSVFSAFWALSGDPHPNTPEFLTSPDQIMAAAHPYKKDDKVLSRLGSPFREPIGKAMAGEYTDATELGKDLSQAGQGNKKMKRGE